MRNNIFTIAGACILIFLLGCSTKKNTASRRFYHGFTTRYNVFFNGNESFKKGYEKIENGDVPDYSHIINMFAVSNSSTSGLGKSDMNITFEKCQKAIKEHSIKKKPKKNMNKTHDSKYMEFYNKEEFNPMMYKVWMLMGKSQYYANDYLAASATFTYIIKHFDEEKEVVAEATIWKAKALKEMDWTYEAESILENVSEDDFTDKTTCLYEAALADLKLKLNAPKEALPHLEAAIALEKNRKQKTRFKFIAAQIYQLEGNKEKAYQLYEEVIKANPDYQMSFNARIKQTEVYNGGDSEKLIKALQKMAKKSNNKDYLDQIYYAIGNVYINQKDTAKAIENYNLSIEKSTRNGLDKVQTLLTLGELYYNKTLYIKAQPCYAEASQIIDRTYPNYTNIINLAQVLGELAQYNDVITLQDSLQALSKMSKSEQLAAANREIEKIRKEEEAEAERLRKQALENKMLENEIENMAVMNKQALGGKQSADWYFYNTTTVQKGKLEFQRKYGNRRLEDNWIRKNKAFVAFDESSDMLAENEDSEQKKDSASNNSVKDLSNKNPEFYLRQIPNSEEQIASSNVQIADALYNMAILYDEKLNNQPKAIETFMEFIKRFPNDSRAAEAYYNSYRILSKEDKTVEADNMKDQLIAKYPDSKYAMILSQPNYRAQLEQMQSVQDSIYEATYKLYLKGVYQSVANNANRMEKQYPVSPLIPKFMLLKSLSAGKSGDKDSLTNSLNTLVERYPNSDVSTMAKDILALIKLGHEPKEGSASSLAEAREMVLTDSVKDGEPTLKGFRLNEKTPYLYYMITDPTEVRENWLLYYTASYNFTKFLVKDFDLKVKDGTMVVSGLDNLDEALWYAQGIDKDEDIQKLLKDKKHRSLVISQENSELIGRGFTIEQYEKFYQDSIINRKKTKVSTKIELVGDQKALDSLSNAANKLNVKAGEDLMNVKQTGLTSTDNTAKQDISNNQEKKEATEKKDKQENVVSEEKKDNQKKEEVKPQESSQTSEEKPKKNLKKYKGLYTYDVEADHKMVLLITKDGVDVSKVIETLKQYNDKNQSLLNLKVSEGSCPGFSKTIEIGILPGAKVAKSYLLQMVKNDEVRGVLESIPHRRILISDDNLTALKTSGNFNVYMELFRRLYLGR